MHLHTWFGQWMGSLANSRPTKRRRRSSLHDAPRVGIEALERREMLTASIQLAANGRVTIHGSAGDDAAVVSNDGSQRIRVSIQSSTGTEMETFARSQVKEIYFYGATGNDTFRNQTNISSEAHGGPGNDTLQGGHADDRLFGEQGDDTLIGGNGNDLLNGADGADTLNGGSGNDTLNGGTGSDELIGGDGDDSLNGYLGDDRLVGNNGRDVLLGGVGNDRLLGGNGDDELLGGPGSDVLEGHAGNDLLQGGDGSDTLRGGGGHDQLEGGPGMDDLFGDAGNDTLVGNDGNDRLFGGAGDDVLSGSNGDDRLDGGDHNDTLYGGAGNDVLLGGSGNDELFGEGGSDVLNGNQGQDSLVDPAGNNSMVNGVSAPPIATPVPSPTPAPLPVPALNTSGQLRLKDFGAVGNGKTDDTAAVQRAFDAAEGRTLFIDPGVYRLTDVILIPSGATILGAGDSSVLAFSWVDTATGAEFHLGNRNRKDEDAGDHNITLRNFVIQGGTNGAPYGEDLNEVTHGLSLRKVRDVVVTGVTVRRVSGFGIVNSGIVRGRFTGNRIHNVGRDGITSFSLIRDNQPSFAGYPLSDLVVSNNEFFDIGDDAIAVHAATWGNTNRSSPPRNVTISGNTIVGRKSSHSLAQGRGIALTGVENVVVSGNVIRDTVSTGILVQSWEQGSGELRSSNVRLVNNQIIRAGQSDGLDRVKMGIQIKGADGVVISNNTIAHSADRGIDVRNATDIDVLSNTVTGGGGAYAIVISGGPEYDVRRSRVAGNTANFRELGAILLHNVIGGVEVNNSIL